MVFGVCRLQLILALENILKTLIEDEIAARLRPIVEDVSFWRGLKDLKLYLDRLSAMTGLTECCDSSLANSFRTMIEFGRFVMVELSDQTPYIEAAREAFITHFARLNLDLLFTAYSLDPNHKMEYMTSYSIQQVRRYILKIYFASVDDDSDDDRIGNLLIDEFDKYRECLKTQTKLIENIYEFWCSRREYPLLSTVAKRLATCHGSSANTERIFSCLNSLITPSRNRLSLRAAFELLTIKLVERPKSKRRSAFKHTLANLEPTEAEVANDEVGGYASEAALLDCDISDELGNLAVNDYGRTFSEDMEILSKWVDFFKEISPPRTQRDSTASQLNRRSDERANSVMARYRD